MTQDAKAVATEIDRSLIDIERTEHTARYQLKLLFEKNELDRVERICLETLEKLWDSK